MLHIHKKDATNGSKNKLTALPNMCLLFLRQNTVSECTLELLTLKVLVATIDAQWEAMGDVGSARYEPALLPPCPTIRVLSCSN